MNTAVKIVDTNIIDVFIFKYLHLARSDVEKLNFSLLMKINNEK